MRHTNITDLCSVSDVVCHFKLGQTKRGFHGASFAESIENPADPQPAPALPFAFTKEGRVWRKLRKLGLVLIF